MHFLSFTTNILSSLQWLKTTWSHSPSWQSFWPFCNEVRGSATCSSVFHKSFIWLLFSIQTIPVVNKGMFVMNAITIRSPYLCLHVSQGKLNHFCTIARLWTDVTRHPIIFGGSHAANNLSCNATTNISHQHQTLSWNIDKKTQHQTWRCSV